MNDLLALLRERKWLAALKYVLSCKYFVFVTALFFLLCYYAGWTIAAIYYVGIVGTLMVLLLDELTPLVGQFPFMSIMISAGSSPSDINGGSDYFFQTHIVVQTALVIAVYALAMFVRLFLTAKAGRLKITPVTVALFALSAAFLLNGAFGKYYEFMDFVYGAIMVFFFLVVYMTMADNVKINAENIKKLAFNYFVFSLVLLVELSVVYLTNNVVQNGTLVKEQVVFGWGVWNTMGMLITVCIPFCFYLACRCKYGYLYFLYASLLLVAAFATTSRQAMLGGGILYAVCWVVMLVKVKGRDRLIDAVVSAVLIVCLIVAVAVFWDKIARIFSSFSDNLVGEDGSFEGNGRADLLSQAWNNFLSSPVFGAGFFAPVDVSAHFVGLNGIIPDMVHNTLAEMLGACGIFGIVTYLGYRGVTVYYAVKNRSFDRAFVAAAVGGLLLVSLFDNHMFYILPTMFYSGLMPFVVGKANGGDNGSGEKVADGLPVLTDGAALALASGEGVACDSGHCPREKSGKDR